jgi:hypothetical protein
MRTALLTATALVALSSPAIAQDQLAAPTVTAPEAKPINPNAVPKERTDDSRDGGRLHYDMPCRVSAVGTCITEPPPYRPRP